MTTSSDEPRRSAPRAIVPVPVGSVAPRGADATASSTPAPRSRGVRGPTRPRPDAVAFAVTLLWVAAAASTAGVVALLVGVAVAAGLAADAGVDGSGVAAVLAVGATIVLVVQLVLTAFVARGSDGARAGLAIVAAASLVLSLLAGGGAGGIGTVLLVVAVAALFVPSSSAWFREVREGGR